MMHAVYAMFLFFEELGWEMGYMLYYMLGVRDWDGRTQVFRRARDGLMMFCTHMVSVVSQSLD